VLSLSRPEGNITGVTFIINELAGKRLDLILAPLPLHGDAGGIADLKKAPIENRHPNVNAFTYIARLSEHNPSVSSPTWPRYLRGRFSWSTTRRSPALAPPSSALAT
jgi:hypothetical protein